MAVIWEVSILARIVRINVRRSVRAFFDDLFSNPAFQPFDLTPAQVFAADDLRFTRDAFDGLIAAARAIWAWTSSRATPPSSSQAPSRRSGSRVVSCPAQERGPASENARCLANAAYP